MTENRTAGQRRWLRFFNRTLYESLAWMYNAMDVLTLGVWWRLVQRALEYIPPGGRVLEVGFGPGKLHRALSARAGWLCGLDLAWGMCQLTRARLARAALPSRIIRGDALHLPLANGGFDVVTSTFAVSGMPDGKRVISEMARIVHSGGRVVLVDIGLPSDGNRAGVFWARLWERMGDFLYDQPALMAEAGLQVVTYEEFGPGRHIRIIVGSKL